LPATTRGKRSALETSGDAMKVVILAGGLGTRISEETITRPKPMIEIGGRPMLWHIMKIYAHFGVSEFIICLGYRGYMIKEYFANYFLHQADVTFDMAENRVQYHDCRVEPWQVTLVDTGEETMTGGRLLQIGKFLKSGEPFCMTYGDGLSNIDIRAELAFHASHGRKATVSCVRPPARFGRIVTQDSKVVSFEEKPTADGGFINGGFFILEPSVLELIEGHDTVWEKEPMENLALDGQLSAWVHRGFWQPMDTLRDKQHLNALWESGAAPWKLWEG
jgi:glucose-1-phosphate cytidylyltransferase